ncbi:nuclear transport factor 2 family protein [Ruixingdingia sedimenti]|uniref:Nuclear transport factor 2 family protein n=1 Tax=Ruixingdingia sedimenti TaxID=3073604 RepID=A0ABU1FAU4_9RHOB|nr:nuclear transport factor 2 family protein [Xinfangfangia sp. LG-4]MDR5654012.1 nuclear transport factor 2 family protein [Xinfangfangia sp. LG-4]
MLGKMLNIEDEREIQFLLAHYVHYLDAADGPRWAALFTQDGRWIRRNAAPVEQGGSGIAAGVRQGRAELAALAEFSVQNFKGLCRHQMTDVVLWQGADAGTAEGKCRMIISDFRHGPGRVAMAGSYDLSFTRTPEGWRIAALSADFLPR